MSDIIDFLVDKSFDNVYATASLNCDSICSVHHPLIIEGIENLPFFKSSLAKTLWYNPTWFEGVFLTKLYDQKSAIRHKRRLEKSVFFPNSTILCRLGERENDSFQLLINALSDRYKLKYTDGKSVMAAAFGFVCGNELQEFLNAQYEIFYGICCVIDGLVKAEYPMEMVESAYHDAGVYYATESQIVVDLEVYDQNPWVYQYERSAKFGEKVRELMLKFYLHDALHVRLYLSKRMSENVIRTYFTDQTIGDDPVSQCYELLTRYFVMSDIYLTVSEAALRRVGYASDHKQRLQNYMSRPLMHDELRYNLAWVKFFGGHQFHFISQVHASPVFLACLNHFKSYLTQNNIRYHFIKNPYSGINNAHGLFADGEDDNELSRVTAEKFGQTFNIYVEEES
ncbi:hypothetical protein ACPV4B_06525 [Vibrio parahaemolyticus]